MKRKRFVKSNLNSNFSKNNYELAQEFTIDSAANNEQGTEITKRQINQLFEQVGPNKTEK